jgi:endonuclease/exonuclease/phosphatase (EEP) superfamily protein YafD
MAVEVMAWNVLDAFSDESRARGVLQVVQEQRPDAAVFSEAWREGKDELLDDVLDALNRSGYTVAHGLYEDNDGRQDRHGIIGIVRSELVADQKPQLVSLGSRNAVHVPVVNTAGDTETVFDFFGAHLDDRSERRRLSQAERLIATADFSGRVVVGGDLNAMHRSDPRAKALRVVRPIARRMPTVDPRPDFKPPKLKRIGSLASRLTDMATGTTLERFEEAGFEDTDTRHQPTKGPFNLDYILVKGLVAFGQRTHDKSPLSDHRAISTSVYAK